MIDEEPQFVEVKNGDVAEISCDATGFPEPEISFLTSNGELVPNGKQECNSGMRSHSTETTEAVA